MKNGWLTDFGRLDGDSANFRGRMDDEDEAAHDIFFLLRPDQEPVHKQVCNHENRCRSAACLFS